MFIVYVPFFRSEPVRTRQPAVGFLHADTSGVLRPRRLFSAALTENSGLVPPRVAWPRKPPGRQAGVPSPVSRLPRNTWTLEMPEVGSEGDALGSQATPLTQSAPRRTNVFEVGKATSTVGPTVGVTAAEAGNTRTVMSTATTVPPLTTRETVPFILFLTLFGCFVSVRQPRAAR